MSIPDAPTAHAAPESSQKNLIDVQTENASVRVKKSIATLARLMKFMNIAACEVIDDKFDDRIDEYWW